MKQLISKAVIGREFYHNGDGFFVYENATKIVAVLNAVKYNLYYGQRWHLYDYDAVQEFYIHKVIRMTHNGDIQVKAINNNKLNISRKEA